MLLEYFVHHSLHLEVAKLSTAKANGLYTAMKFASTHHAIDQSLLLAINSRVLGIRYAKRRTQIAYTQRLDSSGMNTSDVHVYTEPSKIETALEALLQRSITTIDDIADFYAEFLEIHPFRNGNGRTARVLFALLVQRLFGLRFVALIHPYLLHTTPDDLASHGNMHLFPKRLYIVSLQWYRHGNQEPFRRYVRASLQTYMFDVGLNDKHLHEQMNKQLSIYVK